MRRIAWQSTIDHDRGGGASSASSAGAAGSDHDASCSACAAKAGLWQPNISGSGKRRIRRPRVCKAGPVGWRGHSILHGQIRDNVRSGTDRDVVVTQGVSSIEVKPRFATSASYAAVADQTIVIVRAGHVVRIQAWTLHAVAKQEWCERSKNQRPK
jgi:hypothetical protein